MTSNPMAKHTNEQCMPNPSIPKEKPKSTTHYAHESKGEAQFDEESLGIIQLGSRGKVRSIKRVLISTSNTTDYVSLVCFLRGSLANSSIRLPKKEWLALAEALMKVCSE